jgi:isoleucyl-tRNA synthetase
VRLIQNARKDANFQLTDRIAVALQVHGALKAAIVKHGETIKRDTLALHLDVDAELPKTRKASRPTPSMAPICGRRSPG